MQSFTTWMNTLNSVVWGPAMLVLILGTGLFKFGSDGPCYLRVPSSSIRILT